MTTALPGVSVLPGASPDPRAGRCGPLSCTPSAWQCPPLWGAASCLCLSSTLTTRHSFFILRKCHGACGHSVPAAGQGCRSFTLQSLDEVEGILLMQHPWRLLRGCAGKSVRGFVPRSMPLEDRWAVPRFLPGLGGASGCTSTGLLVLFPLNLRQSPSDNPKGKGLGTPGEPRKPWLSSAFRTGGLCRTGR